MGRGTVRSPPAYQTCRSCDYADLCGKEKTGGEYMKRRGNTKISRITAQKIIIWEKESGEYPKIEPVRSAGFL